MSTHGFDVSPWPATKNRALPGRRRLSSAPAGGPARRESRLAARVSSLHTGGWQGSSSIAQVPDRALPLAGDMRPSRVSPRGLGCGDRGRASSALAGAGWHRCPPVNSPATLLSESSVFVPTLAPPARPSPTTPAPCPFRRACALRVSLAGQRLGRTVRCAGLGGDLVAPSPSSSTLPAPSVESGAPVPESEALSLPAAGGLLLGSESQQTASAAAKPWLQDHARWLAGNSLAASQPLHKRCAPPEACRVRKRLRRTVPSKLLTASAKLGHACPAC